MFKTALSLSLILIFAGRIHAQIVYTPADPNVEEKIRFTVNSASGPTGIIIWNFGDGTSGKALTNTTHIYTRLGTFTVSAVIFDGSSYTAQVTVTEQRQIDFEPKPPRTGEAITFFAKEFLDNSIQWHFGDGTVILGGKTQTHVYTAPGNYVVKAIDFEGRSRFPIRTTVRIQALIPSLKFSPEKPRVQEQVHLTAVDFLSNSLIRWDFGDGIIINDTSPPAIAHRYNRAGTFQVRAYDNGGPTVTASVSVRIYPEATLTFKPDDPRPGEEVQFRANDFFSNSLIRWDFGDGTIINDTSPPLISHVYAHPGSYQVRAFDNGGSVPTASAIVTVWPERMITATPAQPKVDENIVFQAINFRSPSIRWDFGDGTIIEGGSAITHTYTGPGIFPVTAYDRRAGAEIPQSLSISVVPQSGPRAPFTISYVNLRFDDGKNYRVVTKNFDRLMAYADLKFEGTGIMLAQWLIDGTPFRIVSLSLEFARDTVIDSGQIPGLPTLTYGSHEVTLRIVQPQMEFEIPSIRYFVTDESFQYQKVNLSLANATNLKKEEFPISADTVYVPVEQYFLLTGNIRNESGIPVPYALLRIYLNEELSDQLLIKDLEVDEERTFETSVYNNSQEMKKIYLVLYNISEKPPALLSIKQLELEPTEN
ncbi:MAG: PKD domain-containing protein [Candidatus Aminicenantes bacterium]|nr:PKD domain-containing protein [Candidatus Aminicenantes bacterium]